MPKLKTVFVIALLNADHERVHESHEFDSYPPDESIKFGLGYKDVAYANVEKRYKLIED